VVRFVDWAWRPEASWFSVVVLVVRFVDWAWRPVSPWLSVVVLVAVCSEVMNPR
jgi:hypothetical protein